MQNFISLSKQLPPFSLPSECHLEETIDIENKNGLIKAYNKDGTIYAALQFLNDRLHGLSSFYNKDRISYSITYQNGVANGWAGEFENDKICRAAIYDNGNMKSELFQKGDNLWEEVDISTGSILSVCSYDENHMRNGIGYIYTNGVVSEVVMFSNNEVVKKLKEIQNSKMKEYNDNQDLVYEGGYSNALKRNGEGKEYSNGVLVYSGNWLDDEKDGMGVSYKNNRMLYQGEWKHNLPYGKGFLLNEDGSILHSGEWINGKLKGISAYSITYTSDGVQKSVNPKIERGDKKKSSHGKCTVMVIQFLVNIGLLIALILALSRRKVEEENLSATVESREDFSNLSKNIKYLVIPSNSCNSNDFTDFSLEHFADLQTITIGDNSLQYVTYTSLKHLNSLTSIIIGRDSFGNRDLGTSMEIYRCDLLQNITIDRYSFISFKKADFIGTILISLLNRST